MASDPTRKYDDFELEDRKDGSTTAVAVREDVISDPEAEGWIDADFLSSTKFNRFRRSVFLQMILFGCIAFVCPAMTDAINKLGGGGLKSPYIANLASALNYTGSCIMSLFGGPLINKLGVKYSCMFSAACYVFSGTGYYVMARYGNQAYLLSARVIGGFTNAFLYVAEATAMLSYPYAEERGKYLGIWTAMRNLGSVAGGAINYGNNSKTSTAGGVAWSTYLVFVGFEASGIIFAILLSQTRNVRRTDGTKVPMSASLSWRSEFVALINHLRTPKMWLMFLPAFYSFYYGGTYGTYLTLHFSVRSRALSSLITPIIIVVTVLLYGRFLDNQRMTVRTRAWAGFALWLVPQSAAFIWTGILYGRWGDERPFYAYDYGIDKGAWAVVYLPYLFVFVTGYWCQLYLYWVLGRFSTDVKSSSRTGGIFRAFEAAGSAVTYSVNSAAGNEKIPLIINCAILAVTIPSMVGLIRLMPDKPVPKDEAVPEPVGAI